MASEMKAYPARETECEAMNALDVEPLPGHAAARPRPENLSAAADALVARICRDSSADDGFDDFADFCRALSPSALALSSASAHAGRAGAARTGGSSRASDKGDPPAPKPAQSSPADAAREPSRPELPNAREGGRPPKAPPVGRKGRPRKRVQVNFRADPEVKAALRYLWYERGLSMTEVCNEAIRRSFPEAFAVDERGSRRGGADGERS